MSRNDAIKAILDNFLSSASPEEVAEFQKLLEKSKKTLGNPGLNVRGMAGSIATDLRQRLGLTGQKVSVMAREIVRDMILQNNPYIPEQDLNILLNKWAPDRSKKWKNVPSDFFMTMISQFVRYGKGKMSENERNDFPEGWTDKYWAFFPEEIQRLISAHLKGQIGSDDFWNSVGSFVNKK